MIKKVLVVDDYLPMLLALREGLETIGYEVTTAAEGQSALHQFHEDRPHLIILDITMPGMDGWEVSRQLRQVSSVPIIILTGYHSSQEDIRKGLAMGADAYLIKPVSLNDLHVCMRTVLQQAYNPLPL